MSFFMRIFLYLVAAIVTALLIPAYFFYASTQESFLVDAKNQAFDELEIASLFFQLDNEKVLPRIPYETIRQRLATQNLRLTLMKNNGDVVFDSGLSEEETKEMDNHADRPEFLAALSESRGFSKRYSNTLDIDFIYVAKPLGEDFVLRLASPFKIYAERLDELFKAIAFVCVFGIVAALLLAFGLSYTIKRQFKTMLDVIEAISFGKYASRLHYVPGKEFVPLANAVNRMAENIQDQLSVMREQSIQLEVIFATMRDGIVLLDNAGNVRRTNAAFRQLLCPSLPDRDIVPEHNKIQMIECLASPLLQNKIEEILQYEEVKAEGKNPAQLHHSLKLEIFAGRHFTVYLARPKKINKNIALIIGFHEITDLVRLEKIRKDFVANVSHELRTPLTAIQGYAETLENMQELPENGRKFATIIHKHSAYLGSLIEELLSLARLENGKEQFEFGQVSALSAFNVAANFCRNIIEQKGLELTVDIDENCLVYASQPELERVFLNLLENACRYAQEQSRIRVLSQIKDGICTFCVENTGVYIPAEHIERIFERFYRVEQDRGSDRLSTGLGLAICKHSIDRHGGSIWAESVSHGEYATTSMIFTLPLASQHTEGFNES